MKLLVLLFFLSLSGCGFLFQEGACRYEESVLGEWVNKCELTDRSSCVSKEDMSFIRNVRFQAGGSCN